MSGASARFVTAVETDIGLSRSHNEDAGFAGAVGDGWTLLAVADGLGGHARGEWASARTVELVSAFVRTRLASLEPRRLLEAAFQHANWSIHTEAFAMRAPGSATTLVAALVREGQFWWANVGDSRLYLHDGSELRQVSVDHSWVQEQVDAGLIKPEDARNHPSRNVVSRTIGFEAETRVDTAGPVELPPAGTLLLCSDGLFGPVAHDSLAAAVSGASLEATASTLVQLANRAGGPDNITVALGRYEP
jgi:serine/threonine protein phosphatase PrpC